VRLHTAKLNTAKLNTAKLNTAKLNTAKLNTAKLNTAKLNTAKLNTAEARALLNARRRRHAAPARRKPAQKRPQTANERPTSEEREQRPREGGCALHVLCMCFAEGGSTARAVSRNGHLAVSHVAGGGTAARARLSTGVSLGAEAAGLR
jgi:hypothetical protein